MNNVTLNELRDDTYGESPARVDGSLHFAPLHEEPVNSYNHLRTDYNRFSPIEMRGTFYRVAISDNYMKLGCKFATIEKWLKVKKPFDYKTVPLSPDDLKKFKQHRKAIILVLKQSGRLKPTLFDKIKSIFA